MKKLFLIGLVLMCASLAYAVPPVTHQPVPGINATISEPATVPHVRIVTSANANVSTRLFDSAQSLLQIPNQAFKLFYRIRPVSWMQDGTYTLKFDVRDAVGNTGNYTWQFTVDAPGQDIILVSPPYGGTNETTINVDVRSELPSECRWISGEELTFELTDSAFFASTMRPFNSGAGPANLHTIIDFFAQTGALPLQNNTEVDLAVSCNDGVTITARHFPVTYSAQAPDFTVSNTPNPITDATFPYTDFTIDSPQEVWCSVHTNTTIFGAREYAAYQTHLEGTWHDSPIESSPRPIPVTCYNRAGMSATVMHPLDFNYSTPLNITVYSPQLVSTSTYTLNFSTNNFANCTVQKNGATVPVTPTTPARWFSVQNTPISGGNTNFNVTCKQRLPPQPAPLTVTVTADLNNPAINSIIVPTSSCNLVSVFVGINASDAAYSSGIASYNYSLQTAAGDVVVPWTVTNASSFRIPNLQLTENATYVVRASVTDNVGRTSSVATSPQIIATSADHSSCDKTYPTTYAQVKQLSSGTNVIVACQDDRGCASPYYSEIVPASNECGLQAGVNNPLKASSFNAGTTNSRQSLAPHVTNQTGKFCWIVYDTSGLATTGQVMLPNRTGSVANVTNTGNETPTTCENNVRDGSESDVDCGGPFCASEGKRCTIAKRCNMAYDCSSNRCDNNVCATATCTDGLKNGNETGVDCGGSCTACTTVLAPCNVASDCTAGKTCDRGVCVEPLDPPDYPETRPPTEEEPSDAESGGFGALNLMLIVTGLLAILGGSAYVVLYEKPKRFAQPAPEPIAVFEPPVDRPQQAAPQKPAKAKRKKVNDARRRAFLADFNTPEELAEKDEVSHREIEHAFNTFDTKTFKEVTKQLLQDNKVQKHDVEIALADAASKGATDQEALDDLRKEFNLKE